MRRSRDRQPQARLPGSDWIRLAFLVTVLALLWLALPFVRDPGTWRVFAPHGAPAVSGPQSGERLQGDGSPVVNDGTSGDAIWFLIAVLMVLAALRIGMLVVPRISRPKSTRPAAAKLSTAEREVASWLESEEPSAVGLADPLDADDEQHGRRDRPPADESSR